MSVLFLGSHFAYVGQTCMKMLCLYVFVVVISVVIIFVGFQVVSWRGNSNKTRLIFIIRQSCLFDNTLLYQCIQIFCIYLSKNN